VFPGSPAFESRLYILHVFVIPALLAALIGAHLAMIMRQRHTQFRGPGRREDNVVGTPMWPGYALRSLGLFLLVAAVLVFMGGLVQINPIWLWGPYHVYVGTNGAQPDWYLGWLIGALRLMPNLEISIAGHTIVPNPFFGGVLFPTLVFGLLYALPWIDRRFFTRDRASHHLLERPRDNPRRTALAASVLSAIVVVFAAGSADRLFVVFGYSYEGAIDFFRIAFLVVPLAVYAVTRGVCRELHRSERHPLRHWSGSVVRRGADGGFHVLAASSGEDPPKPGGASTESDGSVGGTPD
jgi:ubiquinol-cytochrome c reductase cytochrome b subunit